MSLCRQTCNQSNQYRAILLRSRQHQQKARANKVVRPPRFCWGSIPTSHHASQTKRSELKPPETSQTACTCQSCQPCQVATRRPKTCGLKQVVKSGLPWCEKCISHAGASVAPAESFRQDIILCDFGAVSRHLQSNLIRHHAIR